uniref:Uncharacterized protein n=1 Tax=Stomoxys calcitrans TaxID=35570 RepID=A0A1I8PMH1_STOCA
MSDLNDDLLNYDIGDVIDDQVLIGADEDELLLSDEDLEKDVSKEEKQKIKSEAEEWVKSQISDKPKNSTDDQEVKKTNEVVPIQQIVSKEPTTPKENTQDVQLDHEGESKENVEDLPSTTTQNETSMPVEVSSSSNRDLDIEQSSTVSNSTVTGAANDSCASSGILSSQESASVTLSHGDISDPREDFEEEREERTNIKTTSERESFEQNTEHSPEKTMGRFVPHQKRNGAPLIRGHPPRGPSPLFPRPPLRFPHHGNISLLSPAHFTPLGGLATVTLTHATTNPLIPGQPFLPPQQPNTNPFGPQHPSNTLHNPNHGPIPPQNLDHPNPHPRPRHPFGFRPGPMGGFRHPNPASMYSQVPHDFNQGPAAFSHPFGGGPRLFRPEGPMGGVAPNMRPGMRIQRQPLQALSPHPMPGQGNFMNPSPLQIRPQPVPGPQPPSVAGQVSAPGNQQPPSSQMPAHQNPPSSLAPRKVLINPNFKGGVEAATSKFIQETQYMNMNSTSVARVQSDEELLRQQEEFINKNREHIEKRRHAREASPVRRSRTRSPRSRSRTRSRSISRERSYTPPKRQANGGPNRNDRFDRERDRERERDRNRDRPGNSDNNIRMTRANSRDRDERDRERNRPMGGYNNRPGGIGSGGGGGGGGGGLSGGNRFRRGNSRDRDYQGSGSGGGNYGKRRRSKSPSPSNRGGGGNFGRGRYNNERDKPEVDEDEETRAYRLQIEKQKALREQIMRDKEMKRRRAAEEKQYEDKRGNSGQQGLKDDQSQTQQQQQQQQPPQKFKEVIPERKMISLKKRPTTHNDNFVADEHMSSHRKAIPTAKILPEAKKTLTEHLTNNVSASSGGRGDHSNSHNANTAVIKPVIKDTSSSATVAAIRPQPQNNHHHQPPRRLSSRCEDEVQLDYDEDDLLLDEEDLLASESEASPPRDIGAKQRAESHTPSPEPTAKALSRRPLHTRGTGGSGGAGGGGGTSKHSLSSSNRRIVLKTSSGSRGHTNPSGNSSSRRVILDRLDGRSSRQQSPAHGGDTKRKPQRIILKHD